MIALGCDHGGLALKNAVKQYLEENQIPYRDFGTMTEDSIDYAPVAVRWRVVWPAVKVKRAFSAAEQGSA